MVHIECGKCGYSCGTPKAWKRHEQPGCWQLPLEATMTPEERLATKYGLQWSDMKDLKNTFEAFGQMSDSGGIERVEELKLCFRALEVSVEEEDWEDITRGLGADLEGRFERFGWDGFVAMMSPYIKVYL